MWEMTNVQDVVDTGDDYPLSQGHLWQTQNLPFHIAIDTKDESTRVGKDGRTFHRRNPVGFWHQVER